jgi:hypothetical protein
MNNDIFKIIDVDMSFSASYFFLWKAKWFHIAMKKIPILKSNIESWNFNWKNYQSRLFHWHLNFSILYWRNCDCLLNKCHFTLRIQLIVLISQIILVIILISNLKYRISIPYYSCNISSCFMIPEWYFIFMTPEWHQISSRHQLSD